MNSLLQTFFIAILGVFLLTVPVDKRLSSSSIDPSNEVQRTSVLIASEQNIDSPITHLDDHAHNACTSVEVPNTEKQINKENTPDDIPFHPYLAKGLNKFFMFVGYLTGFEKLSTFVITQSL